MSYVITRGGVYKDAFHSMSVRWMRDHDSVCHFEFHILWGLSRKYLCSGAK